jgi:hypothetical protein
MPTRILAQDAAVGADKAELAGHTSHPGDSLSDGMHRVVVAGTAEEGQPPGQGQAAWIIGRDFHAIADVEYRHSETAVQVEGVNVVDADAGHGERLAHPHDRRRRVPEIRALQQRLLFHIRVPMQVHPLFRGDPQASRRLNRHQ